MKIFSKIKKWIYILLLFIFQESLAAEIQFQNPLGQTSDVWMLIPKLLDVAFSIAIPLCVGVIIYAGYLYITSAGNEKKIQQAHKTLIWGLIGFGVLLISKSVPKLIQEFLTS